jgi:hypothetical protein
LWISKYYSYFKLSVAVEYSVPTLFIQEDQISNLETIRGSYLTLHLSTSLLIVILPLTLMLYNKQLIGRRILLEKLIFAKLVKILPAFYGKRNLSNVPTKTLP